MRRHPLRTTPLLVLVALAAAQGAPAHRVCVETTPADATDATYTLHGDATNTSLSILKAVASGNVSGGPEEELLVGQRREAHVLAVDTGVIRTPNAADDHFEIHFDDAGTDCSVAALAAGNLDGDAYPDLAIAIDGSDYATCLPGIVYVFRGPIPTTGVWHEANARVVIRGTLADNGTLGVGGALAIADVSGDGIGDLLIGDPNCDQQPLVYPPTPGASLNAGAAHVVCGRPEWLTGPPENVSIDDVATFKVLGESGGPVNTADPGDSVGTAVAAGDVDRDGTLDLIVTAPRHLKPAQDPLGVRFGRVWVFYGPLRRDSPVVVDLRDPVTVPHLYIDERSSQPGGRFGQSVTTEPLSGARTRLVVGAPDSNVIDWVSPLRANAGRVAIFDLLPHEVPRATGMQGLWGSPEDLTIVGLANQTFGESLGLADTNGDFLRDLVVGAPGPLGNPNDEAWVLCNYAGLPPTGDPPRLDMQRTLFGTATCGTWANDYSVISGSNGGFGTSVAVGGAASNWFAVGSPTFGSNEGAVHAFAITDPCLFCNEPPHLPPFSDSDAECTQGLEHVELTSDAVDCDGEELVHHWESIDCADASFDPNDTTDASTTLTFDAADGCDVTCSVRVIVTDCRHDQFGACDVYQPERVFTMHVRDTVSPTTPVIADKLVECPEPPSGPDSRSAWLASATTTDDCSAAHVEATLIPPEEDRCGNTLRAVYEVKAIDDCGNESATVEVAYVVQDTTPPVMSLPSNKTVECPAPTTGPDSLDEWIASATATDTCGTATLTPHVLIGLDGCALANVVTVKFNAEDECGNAAVQQERTYTIVDTLMPILHPPVNTTVECPAPAGSLEDWLASATASDACDENAWVTWTLVSETFPCPGTSIRTYRFEAHDHCGNESDPIERTFRVEDTTNPTVTAPANKTVECPAPPSGPDSRDTWLASATGSDACSSVTIESELVVPRVNDCGASWHEIWRFRSTDACGRHSAWAERTYTAQDTLGPILHGVPGDTAADCASVPPPASVTETDCYMGTILVLLEETITTGSCAGNRVINRRWSAQDPCGNVTTSAWTHVTVTDTHGPTLTRNLNPVGCMWPPNHQRVTFPLADFAPSATDDCSGVTTIEITDCRSNQPEDANGVGDGSTVVDCEWTATTVSPRSERDGVDPSGRTYTVWGTATDGCGNAGPQVEIGTIHVPHDQRRGQRRDCKSPND